MNACETHKHGKYVTFCHGSVYHLASDELKHTLCGVLLIHPYRVKSGEVVNIYDGGTRFPEFYQHIPANKHLCTHCYKKQVSKK